MNKSSVVSFSCREKLKEPLKKLYSYMEQRVTSAFKPGWDLCGPRSRVQNPSRQFLAWLFRAGIVFRNFDFLSRGVFKRWVFVVLRVNILLLIFTGIVNAGLGPAFDEELKRLLDQPDLQNSAKRSGASHQITALRESIPDRMTLLKTLLGNSDGGLESVGTQLLKAIIKTHSEEDIAEVYQNIFSINPALNNNETNTLNADQENRIRLNAARSIEQLGPQLLKDKRIFKILEASLADPNASVRSNLIGSLSKISDPAIKQDLLVRLIATARSAKARTGAMKALLFKGDTSLLLTSAKNIADDYDLIDSDFISNLESLLPKAEFKKILPAVLEEGGILTKPENSDARAVMASLSTAEHVPLFHDLLSSKNKKYREAAVRGLQNAPAGKVGPLIRSLALSDSDQVRAQVPGIVDKYTGTQALDERKQLYQYLIGQLPPESLLEIREKLKDPKKLELFDEIRINRSKKVAEKKVYRLDTKGGSAENLSVENSGAGICFAASAAKAIDSFLASQARVRGKTPPALRTSSWYLAMGLARKNASLDETTGKILLQPFEEGDSIRALEYANKNGICEKLIATDDQPVEELERRAKKFFKYAHRYFDELRKLDPDPLVRKTAYTNLCKKYPVIPPDLDRVLRLYSDVAGVKTRADYIQFLREILECEESTKQKQKNLIPSPELKVLNSPEQLPEYLKNHFSGPVDRTQPVILTFCCNALLDGKLGYEGVKKKGSVFEKDKKCENHSALIVGYEEIADPLSNQSKRKYLIHNNWGQDCSVYPSEIQCEGGKVWLDENYLSNNSSALVRLPSPR